MTEADIPPGGEGTIAVTFDAGHRKGTQQKSITVTSNDPVQPTTRIYVTAEIVIEFGFTARAVNFRTIDIGKSAEKTAFLVVKDPQATGAVKFETSSPYVSVKQGSPMIKVQEKTGIEVTITLQPGMPPGTFRETITASSTGPDSRTATLSVSGVIREDIICIPRSLRFFRSRSSPERTSTIKRIQIINRSAQPPLNILAVKDPDDRLHLELRAIQEKQRYEVIATVKAEALEIPGAVRGAIHITTDNTSQKAVTVDYVIDNQP